MAAVDRLRQLLRSSGFDIKRYPDNEPSFKLARLLMSHRISCVVDVGANRGQFAQQLRRYGYTGVIHSFEPVTDTYGVLAGVAQADDRWHTHHCALGATSGSLVMHVAGNEGASSSARPMLDRHLRAAPQSRYVAEEEVRVFRLDEVLREDEVNERTFLKIDTQGYELEVIEGSKHLLPQILGLQVELSFIPLYEGAPDLKEALTRIAQLQMVPMSVEEVFHDPHTGQLLQVDAVFFRTDVLESRRARGPQGRP